MVFCMIRFSKRFRKYWRAKVIVIDGKKIAAEITSSLKVDASKERPPGLAFVLVGKHPASQTYVKMKERGCKEVGIHSETLELNEAVSEEELLKVIAELNETDTIDGILVQLPLPDHISASKILMAIDPAKDVDGFHPLNMGKLLLGESGGFIPCTPLGVATLLKKEEIATEGKHVVILGRSNIVGKPLAALLVQKELNATVTIAHSKTKNMGELCRSADILIAAIGHPRFVGPEFVREGAVVIAVGINRLQEGLVGDVDTEAVSEKASMITPVPGGVGPMTIAMLLSNTFESYKRRCGS